MMKLEDFKLELIVLENETTKSINGGVSNVDEGRDSEWQECTIRLKYVGTSDTTCEHDTNYYGDWVSSC